MTHYPAFLDLRGKKAVVVGGGRVAERKVLSLLEAGAEVTVISPQVTPRLARQREKGRIRHLARNYRNGDLAGSLLVIAATDSPQVNARVSRDAPGLVNVVDVPSECSFIVPSVIKRGPLTIAVSTSGVSPAFSKTLRKELEKLYGPGFSVYLRFLAKVRAMAVAGIADRKTRERFLKGLASPQILRDLREKGPEMKKKEIESRLSFLTRDRSQPSSS